MNRAKLNKFVHTSIKSRTRYARLVNQNSTIVKRRFSSRETGYVVGVAQLNL